MRGGDGCVNTYILYKLNNKEKFILFIKMN